MALLYFIRHGQASFGMEQYDRLSDFGLRQSSILGTFLSRCGVSFARYYSGSKERQRDTARLVMREIPREEGQDQLNILREFDEYDAAGILKRYFERESNESDPIERIRRELKDREQFFVLFQKVVWAWFSGDLAGAGLESRAQFRERVLAGRERITEYLGNNDSCAVFTSGGVIAVVVGHALGISDQETYDLAWRIRNASVTVFSQHAGRIKLLSFNSVAHFEVGGHTNLITYR